MADIFEILKVAGPWGGPVVVFGYLYVKRHIATGRELRQLEDLLAREREERRRERDELRRELAFWRDIAWSTSRIADQVVGALPPRETA